MKVYSEQQINRFLRPIVTNSKRKLSWPLKVGDVTYHRGYLDAKTMMMLDVLTTLFYNLIYNRISGNSDLDFNAKILKREDPRVIQNLSNFIETENTKYMLDYKNLELGIIKEYPQKFGIFNMTLSRIKDKCKFLYRYKDEDIEEILMRLSEVVVSTRYAATFVEKKEDKDKNVKMVRDKKTRTINIRESRIVEIVKVGDGVFNIKFLNPLGMLILQNSIAANFMFLTGSFYSMSEYAQNIYRFFRSNINTKFCIDYFCEQLAIGSSNVTLRKQYIEGWLKELTDVGYIVNGRLEVDELGTYITHDGTSNPKTESKPNKDDIIIKELSEIKELLKALLEASIKKNEVSINEK